MNNGNIYVITNLVNSKKYVGQTKKTLSCRFNEHKRVAINGGKMSPLHHAIRKYGVSNFQISLLHQVPENELDNMEIKYIADLNTICPNGYNIKSGGKNGTHCAESRLRMSIMKKGSLNPNFGKPRSESTKKKISDSHRGEKHHFFNKKLSYDHKIKLSISRKKYDTALPIYIAYIKERPQQYQYAGYAVTNHPTLKNKYFTSKKYSMDEKLSMAIKYLNSSPDKDAVQRLDVGGSVHAQA